MKVMVDRESLEQLHQDTQLKANEIQLLRGALERTIYWHKDHPGDGPAEFEKFVRTTLAASRERLP